MNLRMIFMFPLCLLLAAAGLQAESQEGEEISTVSEEIPTVSEPLGYGDACWLGIVEGITEFLPISSTAHLILVAHWLDLNDKDTQILDLEGNRVWYKEPTDNEEGIPVTRKHAVDTYNVVLQGGTILAVVILYWRTILFLVIGCLRLDAKALRMSLNIFLAFLPIVPLGILIEPRLQQLFQPKVLVWGMLVGTFAIVVVEIWRRVRLRELSRRENTFGKLSWDQLTHKQALAIGLIQCVALIPGFSRALSVMLGGYLVGLRPGQAAEFSFLVGLPTVVGAALYKGYKDGGMMLDIIPAGPLLVGMLVSAVTALLAVWWLRNHMRKWGLWFFAGYRFLLVSVLFATWAAL